MQMIQYRLDELTEWWDENDVREILELHDSLSYQHTKGRNLLLSSVAWRIYNKEYWSCSCGGSKRTKAQKKNSEDTICGSSTRWNKKMQMLFSCVATYWITVI